MRKALILSALVVSLPALLLASGPEPGVPGLSAPEEAAVCPAPPVDAPDTAVPVMPCKDCTVLQFSPRFGVVCTFASSCQPGANGCCEYNCACGISDGLPGTPSNACAFTQPTDCCSETGPPALCPRKYCNGVGESCVVVGCGSGCCIFQCGQADSSCTGFDPIPPEAC